jgi:hypothetical protein
MNPTVGPNRVTDALATQLAEVRALNQRLEVANRDLGRDLSVARARIAQLEQQQLDTRNAWSARVAQLEGELARRQAPGGRLRRVCARVPGVPTLVRLLRKACASARV